jgi:hypothetical protein
MLLTFQYRKWELCESNCVFSDEKKHIRQKTILQFLSLQLDNVKKMG